MKNAVTLLDLERKFIICMMDFIEALPMEYEPILRRLPEINEEDFWSNGGFKDKLKDKLKTFNTEEK